MSTRNFGIYEFSSEHLYEALSNNRVAASEVARQKKANYLYGYLCDLNAIILTEIIWMISPHIM